MYLLAVVEGNVPACGTDFNQIVESSDTSFLVKRAKLMAMRKPNITEIYAVRQYTQRMCEMDGKVFANYIKRHGFKLYERLHA